jgi:hypothetical protein
MSKPNKHQITNTVVFSIFAFMAITLMIPQGEPTPAQAGEINQNPGLELIQEGKTKQEEAQELEEKGQKLEKAGELLIEACKLTADNPEDCGSNNYDNLNQELEQLPATSEDSISKKETGSVVHPTQATTLSIEKIQKYKDKYFPTSPITAEMIFNQSAKSGVPADFILAVGHNESHMGTKGRAVQTKNPFNVGNTDAGDTKAVNCSTNYNNCLEGWQAGLDAFTSLITRCYFHEGEEIKLQTWIDRDFRAVRCNIAGKRYMTDTRAKIKYAERIQNLKQL